MKKTLYTLLTLVMVIALAVAFTACGAAEEAPVEEAPVEEAPVEEAPVEEVAGEAADWTEVLSANLDTAYVGASEAGEYYYLGFGLEGTFGVIAILNDAGEYVSFVGPVTDNGEGSFTIVDEANEISLTFTATEIEDGSYELDLGEELGMAYVVPCEVSELVDAFATIDENAESVA